MEIRQARKTDKGNISALIYSAGPELYDFLYKTSKTTAEDYIAYEFASGRGFCGYKNVTVAIKDGQVVATGCFYDGRQYNKLLLGSLLNMGLFFKLKTGKVLKRSKHLDSIIRKPKLDELYLANFGVCSLLRGQGIGRTMIEQQLSWAKSSGYRIFSLDVADTNPRAENLYQRLGLKVTKVKNFTGKRMGIHVPNAKKWKRSSKEAWGLLLIKPFAFPPKLCYNSRLSLVM